MCNGVAQCARLCRMRVACTRRVSTATRFLCASKRWHATVSYRGGAGKINFADEGRKGTRKKGTGYQREGCQAGQDGCGARMGQNRWKRGRKGLALPVRLLVQRTVRRIAIQTFSAHFFVPPAGELFFVFVFLFFSGLRGGCWGIELQFARNRGQKRKPTNLAARSKNALRRE